MKTKKLAKGLGWFSIGLGLAEVAAPERVARWVGIKEPDGSQTLLRGLGVREIVSGLGILSDEQPTGWMWARVAGDAMDLSLTTKALTSENTDRSKSFGALAALAGITALDVLCSIGLSGKGDGAAAQGGQVTVKKAITVNRSPEDLYAFWHDFENLPRFMTHLQSVQSTGDGQSHWKANAPAGRSVEWDAEVVDDQPGQRIAWRSLPGAQVENSGSVRFVRAAGGRGAEVHVEMRYSPPGGKPGAVIAKMMGEEPHLQIQDDLRAFKQVMETGEIVRSDGSPQGSPVTQRPAQPMPEGQTL